MILAPFSHGSQEPKPDMATYQKQDAYQVEEAPTVF
jgi:hypothetical protein